MPQFLDEMVNLIMIDIKNQDHECRYPQKDQKGLVLVVKSLPTLEAGHQGSGNPSNRGDGEKDAKAHGRQTQEVA